MTVQYVMSGVKPHQNDLMLPGQQVVAIPLYEEKEDERLILTNFLVHRSTWQMKRRMVIVSDMLKTALPDAWRFSVNAGSG